MPTQPFSPETFSTFGDLLKYLRRRARLTQLELSIAVGYSEAQISRLEQKQRLPDLAAVKALFISALHLEGEREIVARLFELAQSARQEDSPAPGLPPYKGLLYFDESDSDLFFGREALTSHLCRKVTDLAAEGSTRFLVVVGASGSGKSSLVRAGLAATLKRAGWDVRVFTPTATPLRILEANLEGASKGKPRTLILVDQFEETFTLCHAEAERIAFIEKLLHVAAFTPASPSLAPRLVGMEEGVVTVVIALRADFYSHCAQYPLLRQAVAAEQEYIGQMTTAELRRAIQEPAKHSGWDFEPGLVDVLLQDVGAQGTGEPEPGALPLLSHALLATWERRRSKTFTLEGYRASGGVRSAIAETAENVFTDQLNQQQQELARDVFLRLTELGEGTEDTRRRAALNELVRQAGEATQLRAVLNTLAEARLITLNEDSAEVAHEALIREWHRLHEWLTQDREGLRLHRHITESARDWELRGRDAGELYRGARLAQGREWSLLNRERLNASELEFLDASFEQEQHAALQREQQRRRELESARKLIQTQKQAAGRLKRISYFLSGALLVVGILAGAALNLRQQANQSKALATSRELAAASINNLEIDPERSILLALQGLSASGTKEAQEALHRAVMASRVIRRLPTDSEVNSVAYSPDGTRLVTAGQAGIAAVWEVETGKQLLILKGHSAPIAQVAFSPDGKRIATASDDATARIWDAATGDLLFTLTGHTARINGLAFSPDGERLATVSEDTTLRMWDLKSGSLIFVGPERTNDRVKMISVTFSPDGTQLATGSVESVIEIWDSQENEPVKSIFNPDLNPISSLEFSPDGVTLASTSGSIARLWNVKSGQNTLTFTGHTNIIFSVKFSPDGNSVATAGLDRKIHIWDSSTGKILITLSGHQGAVNSVAFNPHTSQLASASDDGDVRIWDAGPTREVYALDTPDSWARVALSRDGKLMAEGVGKTIRVWDVQIGEQRYVLSQNALVNGVAFDPSGARLASADAAGLVKIWDLAEHKIILTLKGHTAMTNAVAFSPDGKLLVSGGEDNVAKMWNVDTGKWLFDLRGHANPITSIAFNPHATIVATGGVDNIAILWDAQTGEQLRRLEGHQDVVWGVAFSPDGKRIVTASRDATIKVWDSETGKLQLTLTGHTSTVVTGVFSPDGLRIASSAMDGMIKIWDANTGELQLTLYGDGSGVGGVGFTPDGTRLITASDAMRAYALDLSDLIALAQSRLTRTLTTEECREFLHMDACPPQ